MLVYVLCGLAALLWACWVRLRWRRVRGHWARRGVPHAPPHPLLGSLTFLMRENMSMGYLRRMYAQFRSPYVGMWYFWRPALIVNCPELIRRILVTDSDNFRNRFARARDADVIGSQNLLFLREPKWSQVRRRLTTAFTAAKLRAVQGLVSCKAKELVQRILTDTENNTTIDLRSMYTDYTTDVISTASFGAASGATLGGGGGGGGGHMREITRQMTHIPPLRGLCIAMVFFWPDIVNYLSFTLFPKSSMDYLMKVFRAMVAQRGGYGCEAAPARARDLLDALIDMKRAADKDGEVCDEQLLLAQAAIFLEAGVDSTGLTLTYITYELAYAPHIQDKLYKEILKAKQDDNSEELDASRLSELPYINCVIKEALRKYPVLGWLDREAARDYRVDEQLTIAAGTPVLINVIGVHYDPEIYPQPESFNPDRFLAKDGETMNPFTFLSFGEGPRHCIGERFAYQSVRAALSAVTQRFVLRPRPGAPPPAQLEVDKYNTFVMPAHVLSVEFVART